MEEYLYCKEGHIERSFIEKTIRGSFFFNFFYFIFRSFRGNTVSRLVTSGRYRPKGNDDGRKPVYREVRTLRGTEIK